MDWISEIKTLKWLKKMHYEYAESRLYETEVQELNRLSQKYDPLDIVAMLIDEIDLLNKDLSAHRDRDFESVWQENNRLKAELEQIRIECAGLKAIEFEYHFIKERQIPALTEMCEKLAEALSCKDRLLETEALAEYRAFKGKGEE